MLVPTTVLAQQHFHTFIDRLAAFPVDVENAFRFRTPQQQREILSRLGLGKIDIVYRHSSPVVSRCYIQGPRFTDY